MGPRQKSLGNIVFVPSLLSIHMTLQWGRGKKASEIKIRTPYDNINNRLQWGRGKKASEITFCRAYQRYYYLLQWGRGKKASEMGSPPLVLGSLQK